MTIEGVKKLFPQDKYRNNAYVIFKDSIETEKKMTISWDEGTFHNSSNPTDYNRYFLIEEALLTYQIEASLQANASHLQKVETLSVTIAANNTSAAAWLLISYPNPKTESITSDIVAPRELLGKSFDDVYFVNCPSFPNQSGYTQIYFNEEFGVIGFTDENDNLFVFERFE